jgi:hypothetical protein
LALSDDPFVTIKFAFDSVLGRKALQWKKTSYSKALAFLNVRILSVGDEHGLPHKVLIRSHGPSPSLGFSARAASFYGGNRPKSIVAVGSSLRPGHQGAFSPSNEWNAP